MGCNCLIGDPGLIGIISWEEEVWEGWVPAGVRVWQGKAVQWRDCWGEVGDKNQESKKNCRRNSGKCEDGGEEGGKLGAI